MDACVGFIASGQNYTVCILMSVVGGFFCKTWHNDKGCVDVTVNGCLRTRVENFHKSIGREWFRAEDSFQGPQQNSLPLHRSHIEPKSSLTFFPPLGIPHDLAFGQPKLCCSRRDATDHAYKFARSAGLPISPQNYPCRG